MRLAVVLATLLVAALSLRHDEDTSSADSEYTDSWQPAPSSTTVSQDKKSSLSDLLKEVTGARRLKSKDGMYLRVSKPDGEWTVSMSTNQTCTEWHIEEHYGKATLTPNCAAYYLRSKDDYSVTMDGAMYGDEFSHALWIPFKNEDGSWSFKGAHGTWLRASPDGIVSLQAHRLKEEEFWLEPVTYTPSSAPFRPHTLLDVPSPAFVPTNFDDYDVHHDHSDHDRSSEIRNENQSKLSREVAGRRKLRSTGNKYLTAVEERDGKWTVIISATITKCVKWYIEDHNGTVALRPDCAPGKYMRSHHRGFVDLADHRAAHEMWTPFKNEDGSWSLQNLYGAWLCDNPDGQISLEANRKNGDHFWLGSWTDTSPLHTATETVTTSTTSGVVLNYKYDHDRPYSKIPSNEIAQLNPPESSQSRNSSSSYLIVIFIFAFLVILLLAIFAERRRSIIRKRKQELSLSYRNLVSDELQP